MKNFLLIIALLIVLGIIIALPLYLIVNFVCLVFHLSFRLTMLQAFVLCFAASVLHKLYFGKGDK